MQPYSKAVSVMLTLQFCNRKVQIKKALEKEEASVTSFLIVDNVKSVI